jgi:LysR family hydrogen peroxide-inducible transcriptional activator
LIQCTHHPTPTESNTVDLDALQAFVAVVEHGGFRAAAQDRFTSQPSLSRLVARLEAELGVTLLHRGPGGVRPTSHGETLLAGAHRILHTMEEVRAATVTHGTTTVRLGTAATAAGSYLAPFLSHWIPAHPELRIVMLEDGGSRLRRRLERRECDLAVVAAPVPDMFDHLPITTVTVQALLPPGHRLASSTEPVAVHELHGERILVNGRPFLSTELLLAACRLAGSEPQIVYECSIGQTLAALAEAGLGIAVLGDSVDLRGFTMPRRNLHNGDGEPLAFELHIAWPKAEPLAPIVDQFVRELSAYTAGRSNRVSTSACPAESWSLLGRQLPRTWSE